MQQSKKSHQTPPSTPPASWGRALDLSALAPPTNVPGAASTAPFGASGASGFVLDVTEQSFQRDVVEASQRVPVVLDFWAEWCEPCKQLSPVLEKLATEAGGAWLLGKIDIEANPGLASVFRIQSIPMVMAIVAAQPVDAFSGVQSEQQLRAWLDAVLAAARQAGISGAAPGAAPEEPEVDQRMVRAMEMADAGEFDRAEELFKQILAEAPADDAAIAGLAQVRLLHRVSSVDAQAVLAAAGAPQAAGRAELTEENLSTQCDAADIEFSQGQVEPAFARLVNAVKYTTGQDRDRIRSRLLELFSVLPSDDPRVRTARRNLSNVLF